MKNKFSFLLAMIFTLTIVMGNSLQAQTFRYLKFSVLKCEGYKVQEISWFENGVDYPNPHLTSVSADVNPNGEAITGTTADWVLLTPYDGLVNNDSHFWMGTITDTLLAQYITLDLGAGNAIMPEQVELQNPEYVNLERFQITVSNDKINWVMMLDTTLASTFWAKQTFPLKIETDVEAPSAPENLTANYINANNLKLNWNSSTDNVGVVEYEIFQGGVSIATTSSTSLSVSGLTPDTNYEFYVVASDFVGNTSSWIDEISVYTNQTDIDAPSIPTGITNTYIDDHNLGLSWNPSTDNIAVIGYIVYLNDQVVGTNNNTKYAITGLEAGTTYNLTVKAKDAAGNLSESSEVVSLTTNQSSGNRMIIGTNFWDVSWGGTSSDPFVGSFQSVQQENPWRSELVNEVGIYSGFRYMDWGDTNNSTLSHWLNRTKKTDINQRSVSYEWMIDFSNRLNKDIWICVPHKVIDRNGYEHGNNHFVKKLAILLKTGVDMMDVDLDNEIFDDMSIMTRNDFVASGGQIVCEPLKPNLKIYIEYSNESWNWQFHQTTYSKIEGHAAGLNPGYTGNPDENWVAWQRFHSFAALKIFEQMEDVLGVNNPQVVKIDAYQAVNQTGFIHEHLQFYNDTNFNPRGIYPDAFSPAPYFSGDINPSNGTAANVAILNEGIKSITAALRGTRAFLDAKEIEVGHKFKMIAYEGGQHVNKFADIINRKSEMYDLYTSYLDSCSVYLDEFYHYTHSGRYGDGGAWGAKEEIGDNEAIAHKYRALKDWINAPTPPAADLTPPTTPQNLIAVTNSNNKLVFSWDPSSDNIGVDGYMVYLNGFYMGYSNIPSFEISGLTSTTDYELSVRARDAAGNMSGTSNLLPMTTSAVATYSLTFVITDGTDIVEGASIEFRSNTLLTNDAGQVIFGNLIPGNGIAYTVTKSGYNEYNGIIDIVNADVVEDIVLVLIDGVDDLGLEHTSIFPNPTTKDITIQSEKTIKNITLTDITGRLILNKSINTDNYQIDIKDEQIGVYLLKMSYADDSVLIKRIVKK